MIAISVFFLSFLYGLLTYVYKTYVCTQLFSRAGNAAEVSYFILCS